MVILLRLELRESYACSWSNRKRQLSFQQSGWSRGSLAGRQDRQRLRYVYQSLLLLLLLA
jgi:hypothetical protein